MQALAEQEAKKQGFLAGFFGCSGASTVGMEVGMDLLPSLHPAGIAPECEELFDKHGYAPLAKFYAMEGGEAAYAKYAEVVAGEMCHLCDKVRRAAPPAPRGTVNWLRLKLRPHAPGDPHSLSHARSFDRMTDCSTEHGRLR